MALSQEILTSSPRVLMLHPVVSISSDTLRSTWLAIDSQQTLLWSRMSFGFLLCGAYE